ncbi:MAG TPA: alpha/beta fold hydrolase [Candidatus Binataceae bacterium]|nr:alpha/beta fold hydrolase [Candidatus Binataceae bacterium]
MPFFDLDGIKIHYLDQGHGAPVLLIHGFGSSAEENWVRTGMAARLARRGRVIAYDARGHGHSDKPHDPASYGLAHMRADAVALLDHLKIARARIMGYSMGGRIALEVLMRHSGRPSAVVLGGYGAGGQIATPGQRHRIAAALLAEDPAVIEDVLARRFRRGAERNGKDLRALAACIGAEETIDVAATVDYEALARAAAPVLVATGDKDTIAGDPRPLAGWFRDARVVLLEDGDHVTVPADPRFHQAVEDFFATVPE